ncbi:MAG: serine--tRNA ligase [Gluconacetobacter diazotrophicus]|nr:serine--tRNA ligase [Gluconacetobacter diazotrophicus]
MHDIRAIRADAAGFDADLARRGLPAEAAGLLALDDRRRGALTRLQALQNERNQLSATIGRARRSGEDSAAPEARVAAVKTEMATLEAEAAEAEATLERALAVLPNRLDAGVPTGDDERNNVLVHQRGEPRELGFRAREHWELGEALGMMDFAAAAKVAGSRFVVLRGALARLERALGQFMVDLHVTEHGYDEHSVPVLVNEAAMYGTDKLPKFADQSFRTEDGRWLVPTAEVPLTALVAGEILPAASLPVRAVALSSCFRSEAGAAGRDTRGMLRQHQFSKCELVSVVAADASEAEHERMTRAAETVLERLDVPHRRMLLCSGDTGFGAARTYDLEAWLPGQAAWREISSCSNTRDFQARRMNARVRLEPGPGDKAGKAGTAFVHTLNGSGVAVGRALIAVMENHQQADGSITVPAALRPYMGGLERVAAS